MVAVVSGSDNLPWPVDFLQNMPVEVHTCMYDLGYFVRCSCHVTRKLVFRLKDEFEQKGYNGFVECGSKEFLTVKCYFHNIARNLPILLAIISTLAAEFDTQNRKTKKENARPDVTGIIIHSPKSIPDILILFSVLYTQIKRLCNSS